MASRFWVGGTGTWDASTTTHWASSSNGAGGQSVPGSGDTVTFDANSGGGTVTVNTTVTVQSITMGAFTGTLDFSVNNNNVTLSANTALSYTGSGTRTLKMGSGTWTFTGAGSLLINGATTLNLTLQSSSANLVFTGTTSTTRGISTGGTVSFGSLTIGANTGGGAFLPNANANAVTYGSLSVAAPNYPVFPTSGSTTITGSISVTGASLSSPVGFASAQGGGQAFISSAASSSFTNVSFRDMNFSGGGSFTAAGVDYGNNTGITITALSSGGVKYTNDMGGNLG